MERALRFVTITLIALMVWLYAEGATRKQHRVSVNVTFVAPAGQQLLIEPKRQFINATVRCASSQLEQVKDLFNDITVEVNDATRQSDQNLVRMLSTHEKVVKMGVTVDSAEPETLALKVERLEQRSMRIELVTPADLELAGPATFDRESADVVLPATYASQLEDFKLQARLDANALSGVVPGVPQDREVAVALPPAMASWPHVAFKPNKVMVTFTVKKKEEDFTINLIPVRLDIAPNLIRQYLVEVDTDSLSLRDVKIKGPSDVIGRIREGKVKLEGFLRLEPEDLEKKIESKLPELRLPPGVTVEATLPLIKLKVTRREATP